MKVLSFPKPSAFCGINEVYDASYVLVFSELTRLEELSFWYCAQINVTHSRLKLVFDELVLRHQERSSVYITRMCELITI